MPLTDTQIRNAKPTAKAFKLNDGGGMYLIVTPANARYWRMDYRLSVRWEAPHVSNWRLSHGVAGNSARTP
jgi:hypothetical protein